MRGASVVLRARAAKLPAAWPLLLDAGAAEETLVVIGSGVRRSKLLVPGTVLASLPGAEVSEDLARLA